MSGWAAERPLAEGFAEGRKGQQQGWEESMECDVQDGTGLHCEGRGVPAGLRQKILKYRLQGD